MLLKDVNTGAMSGTWVEVTEALGKRLGLKVEWPAEVNLTTYLQDMAAGKFDVECGGGWPNAQRGKFAAYTRPAFFFALVPVVRADDTRFDGANAVSMNSADITVVTMDGEVSSVLKEQLYPQAKAYSVPPTAPLADMTMAVVTKKADVVLLSTAELAEYLAKNPGVLKRISGPPLHVIPQSFSVALGEDKLLSMLNTALGELLYDGTIERIIEKNETIPGTYLRVAKDYRE
jgi:ABC-type amino acid transport substrate-binding protein